MTGQIHKLLIKKTRLLRRIINTTSIIKRINASPPPPALNAIIFNACDPSVVIQQPEMMKY